MSRRAITAVVASLVAAGLVPLALSAANADPACPVWTDAKGDSTPEDLPAKQNDPDLDILAAAWTTTATDVVVRIKVDKLGTNGNYAPGRDWFLNFTLGGKAYYFWTSRLGTNSQGLVIDGLYDSADTKVAATTATFDTAASVIAITLKKSAFPAIGSGTAAGFVAETAAEYGALTEYWDSSAAPAGTSFDMASGACAFSGFAGAPAPSGSASASASPTATGSATPSATASASASPSASASGSPTAAPPAGDTTGLFDLPRTGCALFTDPSGDAKTQLDTANDTDLDIRSLALRTTADTIRAVIKIEKLGDTSQGNSFGDKFILEFKAGAKTVLFSAGRKQATIEGAPNPFVGQLPEPNSATVNGTAEPKLKMKPTFDTKTSNVIFDIDRAALDTALGAPVADASDLTAVAVRTEALLPQRAMPADSATGADAAKSTYKVGTNDCFHPPAAKMEWLGEDVLKAQYGDLVEAAVGLTAADDTPLAGRKVAFTIGGTTVTGTTDAEGVAEARVPAMSPGAASLVASFAGDPENYMTSLPYAVTVTPEATKITLAVTKGAKTARTVTATLVDDDKPKARPIAGQPLTVTVNGKKAGTVKTDNAGKAVWKKATAGQTVVFTLAAVPGKYAAAKAQSKLA